MAEPALPGVPAPHSRCRARIEFVCGADGVTRLGRREVGYPLHLTRAFLLDESPAGLATVYLQSVSGGLYAGDDIGLDLLCADGAAAHLTTQSPTVVHDTRGQQACQHVHIDVGCDALFEYLPEASILLPGAALDSSVEVRLERGAAVLLAESFLTHDPGGGDARFAAYRGLLRVCHVEHGLLLHDRQCLTGERHAAQVLASEGRLACQSTLVCAQSRLPGETLLEATRDALDRHPRSHAGATLLADHSSVYVRIAAATADLLRATFDDAWAALRTRLTGRSPGIRRK